VLQIISSPPGSNRFVLLKWRWIVEQTFGWLNLSRRLSKDYELLPASSEAFIRLAMLSIMPQRLARQRGSFLTPSLRLAATGVECTQPLRPTKRRGRLHHQGPSASSTNWTF
jgi:hypothetical protein